MPRSQPRWVEAMKKPSRAGGKPAKARPHSALKPTGRNAPKPQSNRRSAADDSAFEVAQLKRELHEALEQQTAISDILRVISNSPSDVQPVLDSVAEHAAHICEAHVVEIAIVDNEVFRIAASFGEAERLSRQESVPLDRSTVTGRAICDLQPVQVADLQKAGEEFPLGRELAIRHGHRTTLSVPLIREGRALGAILVRRTEVRPFEEKHIALLRAFADQAAIAIENVRLFKAEQQRTRELTESLQQQTATADVLKVISRSTFDLERCSTTGQSAARLCDADTVTHRSTEGRNFLRRSDLRFSPEYAELVASHPTGTDRGTVSGRVLLERKIVHVLDVLADPEYTYPVRLAEIEGSRISHASWRPAPARTIADGVIALGRKSVRPFTDKQIELVNELRRPGRHRHREHATAERAAQIAATADRHSRRAEGYQPLDFRSASSAQNACGIGCRALPGGYGIDPPPAWRSLPDGGTLSTANSAHGRWQIPKHSHRAATA